MSIEDAIMERQFKCHLLSHILNKIHGKKYDKKFKKDITVGEYLHTLEKDWDKWLAENLEYIKIGKRIKSMEKAQKICMGFVIYMLCAISFMGLLGLIGLLIKTM